MTGQTDSAITQSSALAVAQHADIMEHALVELRRLEANIRSSDESLVRARWESGRYLLTLKKGKQLPNGLLGKLAAEFGVARSELNARMKCATKYPTEAELSTLLESRRTWTAIKQKDLTDTPRAKTKTDTPGVNTAYDMANADTTEANSADDARATLHLATQFIANLDPASLRDSDGQKLLVEHERMFQRLKDGVQSLHEVAA